jgi:hydrogenase maturation protein HypF
MTLRVRGTVQGVGFRPFVFRVAQGLGIAGWVRNDADGVTILAEGSPQALVQLQEALRAEAPASAVVDAVVVEPGRPAGHRTFTIDTGGPAARPLARVPHDLATCAACRRELSDPGDRRFGYSFNNCTGCGPRYSVIESLPYDRPRTSMKLFFMCGECEGEYATPGDRRFHAQPIACSTCGPRVVLLDRGGRAQGSGADAVVAAAGLIRDGRIVAIKGLGGFQLLARADRSDPVTRLRVRKGRPSKPLAVMVGSLEAADRLCEVGPAECRLLASPRNPIALLGPPRGDGGLASELAPRLSSVGVLLPTTPLHHLLLAEAVLPVVATSGNRGDEPIAIDEHEALRSLAGIADAFLTHDRPIARRVDDSVARVIAGRPVVIRLARGYAPWPLPPVEQIARSLPGPGAAPLLATGGHQKVAVALWSGSQAVLGPHIGDMDGATTRAGFEELVDDLSSLYDFRPAALACDLHPDSFTTRWAAGRGLPVIRVQHHHAHAAAAMVEHGLLAREVLALTWDGTGYGPDGTVWGGEVLRARVDRYVRVASLRTFPLPGNERAVREPRRVALGLLALTLGEEAVLGDSRLLARLGLAPGDARTLLQMARRGVNTPWTSSVGRLFDAVACLVLGAHEVSYEGEAAAWLESAVDPGITGAYDLPLRPPGHRGGAGDPTIPRGDWRPMVSALLADLLRGEFPGVMAARFHNALARWAADVAAREPGLDVVLGGGCFQNRRLAEATLQAVRNATAARVHGPGQIPPGDGGLAAGQLAVAVSLSGRRRA